MHQARALLAGLALALAALPAPGSALQLSFAPLADMFNPAGASAQSLLAMRHAAGAQWRQPAQRSTVALQLGTDHAELAPIGELLDSMLAQLDGQDALDTQLLSNKTAIHAAAEAAARQVNATLDTNVDTFTAADATCHAKTESVDNDKASHEQDVLHCDSELTYISTMKDAMANLKETGTMESLQVMSNLADKITTGTADDKAPLKSLNLFGRDYGTDSANVDAAIANLEHKIEERKTAARDAIARIVQAKTDACDASDAAEEQVVTYELRQVQLLAEERAAYSDLMATTTLVEQSRIETQRLRDTINTVKNKVQELADIPATASIQKMPSSLLQMRLGKFEDIVQSIKDLLRDIHTRIDAEAAAETAYKQAKKALFDAASEAHTAADEHAAVVDFNVTTLSTRVATAQGAKVEAERTLRDEEQSQLRESAMFQEMRALLTGLADQGTGSSALATAPSKAMLALALGAQRSHDDLVTRFNNLIATLERELLSKKSQLQVAYDGHVQDWQMLNQMLLDSEAAKEAANELKTQALVDKMRANGAYATASDRLDANNVIRQDERDIITRLLELVDELKS